MNPVPRPRPRGMDGGTVGATTGPGRGGGGLRSALSEPKCVPVSPVCAGGFLQFFGKLVHSSFMFCRGALCTVSGAHGPNAAIPKKPRNNARDPRGRGRP